ncbi:LuxR C-terminal-related transcriptional regulator [Salmonella enterica]
MTGREIDILRLVGEGLSTHAIAGRLYLSDGTVRNT